MKRAEDVGVSAGSEVLVGVTKLVRLSEGDGEELGDADEDCDALEQTLALREEAPERVTDADLDADTLTDLLAAALTEPEGERETEEELLDRALLEGLPVDEEQRLAEIDTPDDRET